MHASLPTVLKLLLLRYFDLIPPGPIAVLACALRSGSRGRGHSALTWPLSKHWRVRIGRSRRTKERDLMNFIARLRALVRGTAAQDLLEYALLVALIALICVGVITTTGTNVKGIFEKISGELSKANK
jgi:pilus assembly protein Flp/PilA